jgi:hypothetical protein
MAAPHADAPQAPPLGDDGAGSSGTNAGFFSLPLSPTVILLIVMGCAPPCVLALVFVCVQLHKVYRRVRLAVAVRHGGVPADPPEGGSVRGGVRLRVVRGMPQRVR